MKNLLFFLLLALGAVQSAKAVERPAQHNPQPPKPKYALPRR